MRLPIDILCIGSVHWDIIGRSPALIAAGADLPGRITRHPGGVAMNLAMTFARFGLRAALLSAVGRDAEGDELIASGLRLGLVTDHLYRPDDLPTDRYIAIEGANGLIAAIADARSLEAAGASILRPLADGTLGQPDAPWGGLIALDGNLAPGLLSDIARAPVFAAADLRVAPASPDKADRLLPLLPLANATLYLNLEEAGRLCQRRFTAAPEAAEALLLRGARRVLVTDGGRETADGAPEGLLSVRPPAVPVRRVTGAGDTFMAAHIVAEHRGAGRADALQAALDAAAHHVSGDFGS